MERKPVEGGLKSRKEKTESYFVEIATSQHTYTTNKNNKS